MCLLVELVTKGAGNKDLKTGKENSKLKMGIIILENSVLIESKVTEQCTTLMGKFTKESGKMVKEMGMEF